VGVQSILLAAPEAPALGAEGTVYTNTRGQKRPSTKNQLFTSQTFQMSNNPKDPRILQKAQKAVYGDRNIDYGKPGDDFACQAAMVSAYLSRKHKAKIELTAEDMPIIMILAKVSRLSNAYKEDSVVDIAGYAETLAWTHEDRTAQDTEQVAAQELDPRIGQVPLKTYEQEEIEKAKKYDANRVEAATKPYVQLGSGYSCPNCGCTKILCDGTNGHCTNCPTTHPVFSFVSAIQTTPQF
jgi:hypothetical protein